MSVYQRRAKANVTPVITITSQNIKTSRFTDLSIVYWKVLQVNDKAIIRALHHRDFCPRNSPVTGVFLSQIPVLRNVFSCDDVKIEITLITSVMGPTWGPHWAGRNQVGSMLAPGILLFGTFNDETFYVSTISSAVLLEQALKAVISTWWSHIAIQNAR